MRPILTATIFALLATQSQALSCMRPDPISTFQRLADAPERYFVLYGTLTFDEAALPQGHNSVEELPPPAPLPGQFVGQGLTLDGFVTPYVGAVELQVSCLGPWCGSARSGDTAVFFVPASNPPIAMQADPCGDMIFPDPSPAVLEMLTSCMQGNACTPLPFE